MERKLLSAAGSTAASQLSEQKSKRSHNMKKRSYGTFMWRCELNSASSDKAGWLTFEKMAVILWLHKAGALLEQSTRMGGAADVMVSCVGMPMVLTCGAIWGALEACVRFVHRG